MVKHFPLSVGPFERGFHLITPKIFDAISPWPENGMLQVMILHTSAGLCINENADSTVRHDFNLYFDRLAPEHLPGIRHEMEGPDDMPAHIKSVLTGCSISIPIVQGAPALGIWQGIYLCEFRNHARKRNLIITILE